MAVMRKSMVSQVSGLKKILKRCSKLRRKLDDLDVPRGHFAVYVGENRNRFVIPIAYLNHPEFRSLLHCAEEEFDIGYDMGLTIPCEEVAFLSLLTSALR